MADTGWLAPASISRYPVTPSDFEWLHLEHIADGSVATVTNAQAFHPVTGDLLMGHCDQIIMRDFGLAGALPLNAQIEGVQVRLEALQSASQSRHNFKEYIDLAAPGVNSLADDRELWRARVGTPAPYNMHDSLWDLLGVVERQIIVGSPTAKWHDGLDYAAITSPDFAVGYTATITAFGHNAPYIGEARIRVHYSAAPPRLRVNDAGVWRGGDLFVNDNGVWRPTVPFINDQGVWKEPS